MNREELKTLFDIDKNGKVDFEDAVAKFEGNVRKALLVGLGIGAVCGALLAKLLFC